MSIAWNPITTVNLVLCIIIFVFAMVGYRRSSKAFPLYIGLAFGLFGLSHLATLLGLNDSMAGALIVVRTLAYLLVAFAVYRVALNPKSA